METNQRLTVPFKLGSLNIEHKTLMGDVRSWHHLGNEYRREKGLRVLDLKSYFNQRATQEFIAAVSEDLGRDAVVTSRGRGHRMKAHLYVLLDMAAWMDADFKLEVYKTFVRDRICELRDDGGNLFIGLNAALNTAAEAVLGKPAHRGHYVTLAKAIKKRCGVDDWNLAPADAHAKRVRIEDRLAAMLRAGVVRDWDHLKELAEIV